MITLQSTRYLTILTPSSLPPSPVHWGQWCDRDGADRVAAEGIDETGLPAQAYVPTQEGAHAPVPSATQGYTTGPVAGVGAGAGAGVGTAAAPVTGATGVPVVPVVPAQAGTGATVVGQGNKTVFDAGAQ